MALECSMENVLGIEYGGTRDRSTGSKVVKLCEGTPQRMQLEEEIYTLRGQLNEEKELHDALENAVENAAISLPCLSRLPYHNQFYVQIQELLSAIASLEIKIASLEEQRVSLHCQLSKERHECDFVEYESKHFSSLSFSLSSGSIETVKTLHQYPVVGNKTVSPQWIQETMSGEANKGIHMKGVWDFHPIQLSEEMVRCMSRIFVSFGDSAADSTKSRIYEGGYSHISPSYLFSSSMGGASTYSSKAGLGVRSSPVDLEFASEVLASGHVFDPYKVPQKLSWADIGSYGSAIEVGLMSLGTEQLEYAAVALQRFRFLVEQLAEMNPRSLKTDEKLAFWINIYNALAMHAYLVYGIPRSDLKLFSLMQKAAYIIGGHPVNGITIEYSILKMKPPAHRPAVALLLALHKLKLSDEQKEWAIDKYDPLVIFALSSGMYSSPAVRIYTAQNIGEELQQAQRDFVRASVGVSRKGKLLVPKMLYSAKCTVGYRGLEAWICGHLLPSQAAFVERCLLRRRQSILARGTCGSIAFDSSFRYLFIIPDRVPG